MPIEILDAFPRAVPGVFVLDEIAAGPAQRLGQEGVLEHAGYLRRESTRGVGDEQVFSIDHVDTFAADRR